MFVERDLPLLAPCMKDAGITRVANVTGLDHVGIPVVMVVRPSSMSLSVSQGKGATLVAAKLSGIMESLEQFHAEQVIKPLTLASYSALRSRRIIDVMHLPRGARAWDEDARLLWINGSDLATGEELAVPFELVHLDLTTPLPEGSGYFALGSNGLASGQTLDEAIAHGLWELIERDALALFYRRSPLAQAARRVRVDSVDDVICRDLIHRLAFADIGAALWDMTTDIGIAAFFCSVAERRSDQLRLVGTARGYGCHPDRTVALRRAITEAAQSRLTRIAGSRDDMDPGSLAAIRSLAALERHHAYLVQEEFATHTFSDVPSWSPPNAREALDWTRDRLATVDLCEVVYVDLSRSGWPMAVARSVVPGLEGFPDSPDYVPGRRARKLDA